MHGFESSFRRHLVVEQRRAVLEALAKKLGPGVTMGDVLDAADGLGWSEPMGELTLADLAQALLRPPADGRPVAVEEDEEDEEEDEEDDAEDEAPVEPPSTRAKGKVKASSKSTSTSTSTSKAKGKAKASSKPKVEATTTAKGKVKVKAKVKAEPESKAKTRSKGESQAPTKSAKAKSKPTPSVKTKTARLKALRAKVDAEDRMSLEEAAELLVPIVEELGQATMQDLEDFTGIGRRKLRFHIGQLVRFDHLQRHGMGRGTYYTASE